MSVGVEYISDGTKYKFKRIEDITNPENVISINCCGNNLTSLPENMNFPNLKMFNCCFNNLVSLPENMDKMFPLLQEFNCSYSQLESLPENMNFPLLTDFYCCGNDLTSLPENMCFPLLQTFDCRGNNLTSLPENMDKMFPLLQTFDCRVNNLTSLPENMCFPLLQTFNCRDNNFISLPENIDKMFPQLQTFNCGNNKLVSLPVCIMNWRNLQYINYYGNEIELSPQLERFLNRISQGTVNGINVYGDAQNVHNAAIQGSVRDSINRLTTRMDLPKFDSEILNTMILTDDVLLLNVKEQLIEYCQDDSFHSLLLLKFSEVLWYVLNTITHDFSNDVAVQTEIKQVLNQEMQDAVGKCFTGRMSRVVNCLNGFSPLVEMKISDGEQIGNVIVMLKDKALDTEGNYSVAVHKQLVERELVARGYDSETVIQWLEYIE